jgi:hypothetical protein
LALGFSGSYLFITASAGKDTLAAQKKFSVGLDAQNHTSGFGQPVA